MSLSRHKTMRKHHRHKKTHKMKRKTRVKKDKKGKRKYTQKGGLSLSNVLTKLPFGQGIVNMFRVGQSSIQNIGKGFAGKPKVTNPMPTKDQFKRPLDYKFVKPPNIPKIRQKAIASVKTMT